MNDYYSQPINGKSDSWKRCFQVRKALPFVSSWLVVKMFDIHDV